MKATERRQGLCTSGVYVGHIVNGLREHNVPEEYAQHVIETALRTNELAVDRASEEDRRIEALRVTREG